MSTGTIKIVFVHGSGFVSETIERVEEFKATVKEGFVPSHCGIIVDDHFREAIANGFVESDVNKYPAEIVRVYELDVSSMEAVRAKFQELSGREYGYRALFNGFLYTIAGIETNGDGEATGDCSEDDTRIIRADRPDFISGIPADDVTPLILMDNIIPIARLVHLNA
ncbi:hypothetical protein Ga0466249_002307 [Sporomusaceae bacterium BoRhaA]|uniref:hypothetical protein n=1 Tax=Pelorhabdus rhamnosifermentans TaxID=2772457 RepID=UPI001C0639CE|nr:hypothetical protein [Pelorhabdus rhamnosifermentans]MBU2701193.1 hypothetical protein [Pelorhabdus rhamnosifermentans]